MLRGPCRWHGPFLGSRCVRAEFFLGWESPHSSWTLHAPFSPPQVEPVITVSVVVGERGPTVKLLSTKVTSCLVSGTISCS
jgi:hypothetical protein